MDRNAILAEAERLGFPTIYLSGGSQSVSGEAQWRGFAENGLSGFLADAVAQLEAFAPQFAHARGVRDRRDADDATREEAAALDPAVAEEARAEAEADLLRHLAERPARMEALAERQVALLADLLARLVGGTGR